MAWHDLEEFSSLFIGQDILVVAKHYTSDRCVITFTPRVEQVDLPSIPFGAPVLEKAECSFVSVISTSNHWWQTAEFIPAMNRVRRHLEAQEYAKILGYGGSMGGVGVLLSTSVLPYDTAIVYGTQYDISPKTVPWDSRWHADAREGNISFADAMHDLPSKATIAYIYDPFELDRRHFERLSSLLRITPIPLSFAGHEVFRTLHELGLAGDSMRRLLLSDQRVAKGGAELRKIYRDHRRKSPTVWQNVIRKTREHNKAKARDHAMSALSALGKLDLKSTHLLARGYLQDRRDPHTAEKLYDTGIRMNPDHPAAWRGKVQCQIALGRPEFALENAIGALARRAASTDLNRVLLHAALLSGTPTVSAVAAKRLVAAFPDQEQTPLLQSQTARTALAARDVGPEQITAFNTVLDKIARRRPQRYSQLYHALVALVPDRMAEIGVFNGENALLMIESALALRVPSAPPPTYYGFDLFQEMTAETLQQQFSKIPLSDKKIHEKLSATGAKIELFRGNTEESLPTFAQHMQSQGQDLDFIFIDGGHLIETIASDWENSARLMHSGTVVFFDDYYIDPPEELKGVGCNRLIEKLQEDPLYQVDILPVVDRFEKDFGILQIALVRVELRQ